MAGTSLAEQLKKLAVPQTSILVHTKKRQSLLFDPKDAADIDRATFYKIGLSGLEELKSVDSRLGEFEKSLFDETSQHLERAVEDLQANAKLDQLINRFLILLSPYLNLKAAHKALEWLICRFHIHEYNTDCILALILPYHDTNIFARMIQILPLQDKGGRWIWLQQLKKEGIPMSKLFLLSRVSSDPLFLKFICNLPLQGVQVHGEKSYCLTTVFAFYCTTVIGALDQTPLVTEVQVTHLLPSLLAGINSSHLDFSAAAFMILGHLVSKVRLTPVIFCELFYRVARSEQSSLRNEAALVLVVMAQSGPPPSLLPSVCHLATAPWFLPALNQIAMSGVVVYPLVAAIVSDSLTALNNPQQNTQQELLQEFVSKLLQTLTFTDDEAEKLLKLFAETSVTGSKWYLDTLHQLEKSHPQAFDLAVKTHSSLLELMPDYDSRNELFQRLHHPLPEVRLKAVKFVCKRNDLLKEKWVRETLMVLLKDDSPKVVAVVIKVASFLRKAPLVDELISLAASCWHGNQRLYSLGPAVLSHLEASRHTDTPLLLLLTLPFLLPTSEQGLVVAKALLASETVKIPIFKPLCKSLEGDVTEQILSKEVLRFMQDLVNLNVEKVVEAGRRLQSRGVVYQLMTMLVAAGTLTDQTPPARISSLMLFLADHESALMTSETHEMLCETNLAAIVSGCRDGKLPFQGGLFVLSKAMRTLKSPFQGGKYIADVRQPETALIINIFRFVLQMKKSKNKHIYKAYNNFCNDMFKKCCTSVKAQIDLLSSLSLACPDLVLESVLQLTTLVQKEDSVSEHVLVPALLVALHNPDQQVRHHTLALLSSLSCKQGLATYHMLLAHLSQHAEEIELDPEQVCVALYMSLSPDPWVQAQLPRSERQNMAAVLSALTDIVTSPETPAYVSGALLKVLDQINSQSVFERLIAVAMKILLNEERSAEESDVLQAVIKRINANTASAFQNNLTWIFIETCHKNQKLRNPDSFMPAILLLQQIDRELFAALQPEQQKRMLSLIVSCVAETEHSEVTSAAASAVKRISLDAAIIASLLEPMRDASIDPPQAKKRAWTVKKPPSLELLSLTPWKQGLCLLEFIQNKKKLDNVQSLLPILFEILNRCLQFEEQSPVEYTKQVLLTTALHCCVKLSPDGSPVPLPESSVQVELVVECIRVSSNPQTHHHALLLLAHVANMIPERVLHSIMPIFTFMGSSVLRQDDAYSFQIISKIVETIVPVLLKSGAKREMEEGIVTVEVVGVLRVFAGALEDIPEHRRAPLLTKLLTTLGHGCFLWAFLALVFESHVLHPGNPQGKESGTIPKRLEVGLQLCHEFPPATVLSACARLLNYLSVLPVDKGDKKCEIFKASREGVLFDVERATEKQLRHYTYTTLTFLSLLLSSKQFLRVVATLTEVEVQDMKDIFQEMLKGILTFIHIVSKQLDLTMGQPTAKYWKSMFTICFDVLAKTCGLVPGDTFLSVTVSLLNHSLPALRVKALELLNWRLQQSRPLDPTQLLQLLPSLRELLRDQSGDTSPETQQTALLSVKFLARQLAAEHPDHFHQVFKAASKLVKKRSLRDPVLASAVLCVGELSHTLGAHAIASLHTFMPSIINILSDQKLILSGDLLLLSLVSCVHKVVDALACFLSPYLPALLPHLCVLTTGISQLPESAKLLPLQQRIKSIRQKLSSDLPLRVLLPAVSESYNHLVSTHTAAVPALLSLLADSFRSTSDLTPELSAFLISALDFRSQASCQADVQLVEPAVISTIVALILKLSESSFRPFYYKIYNWALLSDVHKNRAITFYKLTNSIAESLKGLFVSFAHYFLKNAASLLDENHVGKQELGSESGWDSGKAEELVDSVLRALLNVLLHDASHFINKDRFDTLMQPLVDQLENELGGAESLDRRTSEIVIPCLSQLAVSASDDTLWKQLNYQILLKTRHNLPRVRIGSVLAVCEIAKKLGEEFLPLLPETVPFLAELLEDEDETVEKTSQKVVQELESALGEPISKYF